MQVIVKVQCQPEEYIAHRVHERVQRPGLCPNCHKRNQLEAHSYYDRGVTDQAGEVVEISVRRFECQYCGKTISCLPDFAIPYRLVNSTTTECFFNGIVDIDGQRNLDLLKRYWLRFQKWAPDLRKIIGSAFSRSPPEESVEALWRRLMAACKSLRKSTCRLIKEFRTTCFGTYQCHQPRLAH